MTSEATKNELIALLPNLRAFAIYLCGNREYADDLVQETIAKAWARLDSFTEGTNLRSWLFTILRNTFFSARRRKPVEISFDELESDCGNGLGIAADQDELLDKKDILEALAKLTPLHRTALILVGAEGFSYEEAAKICDCAVGTIKSRVNRARCELLALLEVETAADLLAGRRRYTRRNGMGRSAARLNGQNLTGRHAALPYAGRRSAPDRSV